MWYWWKWTPLSCSSSYGECFQFFTIENNVCCRLIIYGLYYVEVGSSYAHFLGRVLMINRCWILSKAFSISTEMIIWFLSFSLLIWCIILFDLGILKNPCIPGINPTWSLCMSFLMGLFCIHSGSLCLLVGAFNPFTFKVIIDICIPIAIFLIVWGWFCRSFFFSYISWVYKSL